MQARPLRYILWLLIAAICALAVPASITYAQSPEPTATEQEELVYDEAEAHAINQMIMCPVCPAETIDQAQVSIARQMRQIVREMLAEGHTREEILQFFAQRYGQDILAAPPKSGFNLIAWVFPLVGVAAALVAGVLALRSMSARKTNGLAAETVATPSRNSLAPYLEMVDRELALEQTDQTDGETNTSGPAPVSVEPQREASSQDNG